MSTYYKLHVPGLPNNDIFRFSLHPGHCLDDIKDAIIDRIAPDFKFVLFYDDFEGTKTRLMIEDDMVDLFETTGCRGDKARNAIVLRVSCSEKVRPVQ